MEATKLLEDVQRRMGSTRRLEAVRACDATLSLLGACMTREARDIVARQLPKRFGAVLRAAPRSQALDLGTFLKRLARVEQTTVGFAREHAQAVCLALWMALDEEGREALARNAWPDLLQPSLRDRLAPSLAHRSTLASGRPGSRRPLAEAPPPAAAHRDSVARSDAPHADRKLSSGAPSYESGGTIAAGRPGHGRPLSGL